VLLSGFDADHRRPPGSLRETPTLRSPHRLVRPSPSATRNRRLRQKHVELPGRSLYLADEIRLDQACRIGVSSCKES